MSSTDYFIIKSWPNCNEFPMTIFVSQLPFEKSHDFVPSVSLDSQLLSLQNNYRIFNRAP